MVSSYAYALGIGMARPSGEKNRCGGLWTQARYNSFIKSILRGGSRRWGPKTEAKRAAKVSRGMYKCALCDVVGPATVPLGGRRVDNAVVDHIVPIINPDTGFTTWDDCIANMFCEADNLQVLCKPCHDIKSNDERKRASDRRKRGKGAT